MSKQELEQIVDSEEVVESQVTPNPDEVLAKIVKREDGYHVIDCVTYEEGPVCKLVDEGEKTIALTKNSSNRKWANRAKADAEIEANGFFPLYYKASKTFGPSGSKNTLPNAKLIAYLSEEEQNEYKDIIARAIAARDAKKAQPKTDLEKAQARLAKAKAAYEALLAQAADDTIVEGGNN